MHRDGLRERLKGSLAKDRHPSYTTDSSATSDSDSLHRQSSSSFIEKTASSLRHKSSYEHVKFLPPSIDHLLSLGRESRQRVFFSNIAWLHKQASLLAHQIYPDDDDRDFPTVLPPLTYPHHSPPPKDPASKEEAKSGQNQDTKSHDVLSCSPQQIPEEPISITETPEDISETPPLIETPSAISTADFVVETPFDLDLESDLHLTGNPLPNQNTTRARRNPPPLVIREKRRLPESPLIPAPNTPPAQIPDFPKPTADDGSSRSQEAPAATLIKTTSPNIPETLDAQLARLDNGERMLNQYVIRKQLGKGSFGTVYHALNALTMQDYAVKEFSMHQLTKQHRRRILRSERKLQKANVPHVLENDPLHFVRSEIAVMKKVSHPNIVKLYEVLAMEQGSQIFMILELCEGGPLMSVSAIETQQPLEEDRARHFFRQIVLGLEYLHENDISHCDIKPDNILMMADKETCKIADFGVSLIFTKGNDSVGHGRGTPAFQSPELLEPNRETVAHAKSADIWALGISLYYLVAGKLPFQCLDLYNLYQIIMDTEVKYNEDWSPDLIDVLKRMIDKNPDTRITIKEIREHSWVTTGLREKLPSTEENAPLLASLTMEELDNSFKAAFRSITAYVHSAKEKAKKQAKRKRDFFPLFLYELYTPARDDLQARRKRLLFRHRSDDWLNDLKSYSHGYDEWLHRTYSDMSNHLHGWRNSMSEYYHSTVNSTSSASSTTTSNTNRDNNNNVENITESPMTSSPIRQDFGKDRPPSLTNANAPIRGSSTSSSISSSSLSSKANSSLLAREKSSTSISDSIMSFSSRLSQSKQDKKNSNLTPSTKSQSQTNLQSQSQSSSSPSSTQPLPAQAQQKRSQSQSQPQPEQHRYSLHLDSLKARKSAWSLHARSGSASASVSRAARKAANFYDQTVMGLSHSSSKEGSRLGTNSNNSTTTITGNNKDEGRKIGNGKSDEDEKESSA